MDLASPAVSGTSVYANGLKNIQKFQNVSVGFGDQQSELPNILQQQQQHTGTSYSQFVTYVCVQKVHLKIYVNPFVTSGTYMSHLQRVFSSPLG